MGIKNMNQWQKAGVMVVTLGVTITSIYFATKGVKYLIDKRRVKRKKIEGPIISNTDPTNATPNL